jgi:hypothetical protein
MAAARQPAGRSAAEFYDERAANVPLLVQGSVPRRVSAIARAAACGGNFMSFFGAFWLSVSLMLLVVAIAVSGTLGWGPILFVSLFVAVGAAFVGFGIQRGMLAVRLVSHGRLTWALVNHTAREVSESTDSDGRRTTHVSYRVSFMYRPEASDVHFAEVVLNNPDRIRDEEQELIVYDPTEPTRLEFADLLPGGLRINEMGEASESSSRNLLSLLPFVVIPLGPIFGLMILPQFQA